MYPTYFHLFIESFYRTCIGLGCAYKIYEYLQIIKRSTMLSNGCRVSQYTLISCSVYSCFLLCLFLLFSVVKNILDGWRLLWTESVCVPKNSYAEALIPEVMVLGF